MSEINSCWGIGFWKSHECLWGDYDRAYWSIINGQWSFNLKYFPILKVPIYENNLLENVIRKVFSVRNKLPGSLFTKKIVLPKIHHKKLPQKCLLGYFPKNISQIFFSLNFLSPKMISLKILGYSLNKAQCEKYEVVQSTLFTDCWIVKILCRSVDQIVVDII